MLQSYDARFFVSKGFLRRTCRTRYPQPPRHRGFAGRSLTCSLLFNEFLPS